MYRRLTSSTFGFVPFNPIRLRRMLLTRLPLTVVNVDETISSISPSPESSSSQSRKRRKNCRKKVKSLASLVEPQVSPEPLTTQTLFGGKPATALIDTGSQADVISSSLALKLGLPLRRLVAPLHAALGAEDHSVRLALYATIDVKVGPSKIKRRPFFVSGLPHGIDAILGVPWIRDTGTAVSASSVFVVPNGPFCHLVSSKTSRFSPQPHRDFDDLGFVKRNMSESEQHAFVVCASMPNSSSLDEYVGVKDHNPLLDNDDDDPSLPDISEEQAADNLRALLD